MKTSKYSDSQILAILKEAEAGTPVPQLCRTHGMSSATFYFSLPALRVIRALEQIIEWRGKPQALRCDNGPEYLSGALTAWAQSRDIRIDYIQPGKPQQNAYVERYNRTVRYDLLNQTLFDDLDEVRDAATRWLWTYNHERPNMAIGGITPMQKLATAA